ARRLPPEAPPRWAYAPGAAPSYSWLYPGSNVLDFDVPSYKPCARFPVLRLSERKGYGPARNTWQGRSGSIHDADEPEVVIEHGRVRKIDTERLKHINVRHLVPRDSVRVVSPIRVRHRNSLLSRPIEMRISLIRSNRRNSRH